MKTLVLVVLLAAAAAAAVVSNEEPDVVIVPDVAEDSELTAIAGRRNLHLGQISGSSTVFNRVFRADGIPNRILVKDIPVRIVGSWRITAIRVTQMGVPQNARPSIVSGGLGYQHVTIRITSARGRGYHYRVEVFGR